MRTSHLACGWRGSTRASVIPIPHLPQKPTAADAPTTSPLVHFVRDEALELRPSHLPNSTPTLTGNSNGRPALRRPSRLQRLSPRDEVLRLALDAGRDVWLAHRQTTSRQAIIEALPSSLKANRDTGRDGAHGGEDVHRGDGGRCAAPQPGGGGFTSYGAPGPQASATRGIDDGMTMTKGLYVQL
ncbi:hypothetical protein K438DRAFT_1786902 [Mycena galopus ATCC 62051]|nr:hypothetical protein K438DRAFT_1786902 [Mycena galopus ATCC 62051]